MIRDLLGLSQTIDIDGRYGAPFAIERRRFKRSQPGFRPNDGKRRPRPAARQSRDRDSPARSDAYAPSLRDGNSP